MCGRQCSLNENKKLSGLLRVSGPDAVHHNRTSPPPKIDLIRGRNYKFISSENSQLVSQNLTHTEPEPEPEPDMGVTKEQVESSLKSKMNPSHLVSPNSIFFFFKLHINLLFSFSLSFGFICILISVQFVIFI